MSKNPEMKLVYLDEIVIHEDDLSALKLEWFKKGLEEMGWILDRELKRNPNKLTLDDLKHLFLTALHDTDKGLIGPLKKEEV